MNVVNLGIYIFFWGIYPDARIWGKNGGKK
jgi:hypothetical protein